MIFVLYKAEFCVPNFILFEIFYTGFKDLNILFSINIHCNSITTSFRMSHLT